MAENGFRKGISKNDAVVAAKENKELIDFLKTVTKEEISRVKEMRKFDNIEPWTYTYKIALYLDSLRQQLRNNQSLLYKRLWNIENIHNHLARLEKQLSSGKITEKLNDEITMNEREVKTEMESQRWLAQGEANSIPAILADIRGVVGHYDVMKNVIMTEKEFDALVIRTLAKLKEFGYDILG